MFDSARGTTRLPERPKTARDECRGLKCIYLSLIYIISKCQFLVLAKVVQTYNYFKHDEFYSSVIGTSTDRKQYIKARARPFTAECSMLAVMNQIKNRDIKGKLIIPDESDHGTNFITAK